MSALTFQKLEHAYIVTYENAKELLEESKLLLENKRYARAYFLAQICYEEIAKLPIIYQEATRSFYRETHDWKRFYKRLRNHEDKNRMNIVSERLFISEERYEEHFKDVNGRTKMVNTLKNASLYSDLDVKNFFKPSDMVKEESAKSRIRVAENYLNYVSMNKYHIKGTMAKYLDTEEAKITRKLMKEMGII